MSLMAGDGGTILVADSRDGLSGLVVALLRAPRSHPLLIARKIVEIDNVVVRHDCRRRGIGRRLIEASIEWARARGADDVEVAVHDFNAEAAAFYAALGFDMSVHWLRRRLS